MVCGVFRIISILENTVSMPAAYSEDLREKVIQAVEEGKLSKPPTALLFNMSKHFIYTLCDLHKTTGSVSPKKMGGCVKPKKYEDSSTAE